MASEVICLHKYVQIFNYFISKVKKCWLQAATTLGRGDGITISYAGICMAHNLLDMSIISTDILTLV